MRHPNPHFRHCAGPVILHRDGTRECPTCGDNSFSVHEPEMFPCPGPRSVRARLRYSCVRCLIVKWWDDVAEAI